MFIVGRNNIWRTDNDNLLIESRDGIRCCRCGRKGLRRFTRKNWMKIVPRARYFRCDNCSHEHLYLPGTCRVHSVDVLTDHVV